ncbi:gas vesicle protein GvpG [Candidatus Thiodictyon syntrophicum]|uniref:Gas vesicle protein GvpG n=1 Tax=Candidatus Thiodictyon syntrophicum TaxID=1166950 RepID=A0A2K8U957_9GAMM|nr:gas vesicle protein GvpG [Candidatus Thiodictyon syntrophicum]AUB81571.1 hypothetical protein THSYN_11795 [Candidatus Thiodictyon syntrophicum]
MLLVDDLLAAPVKGILWVFREIENAAKEEQRSRRDGIMASLSALYVSLEQGEITEEVFDDREQTLLDELDALDAKADAEGSDEDDDDDDEEEDGDEYEEAREVPALVSDPATQEPLRS